MWEQQCPQCPHHVVTGRDAAVPYPCFCEAFGFPVGPAGSRSLLLFYELWSSTGVLLQSGRASDCPVRGLHPENLLFDPHQGYLWSVLEACEDVSYVLLYTNYTPCQEPARGCAHSLLAFLEHHPWTRLDVLFSQLYHTQPGQPHHQENQAGLCSLASAWPHLTLSPISGAVWGYLLWRFVQDAPPSVLQRSLLPGRVEADREHAVQMSAITGVGPVFLHLPGEGSQHQTPPRPLIVLPSPRLPLVTVPGWPETATAAAPHPPLSMCQARPRPVNVVRHVRMPPPRPLPPTSSPSSALSLPLAPLPVEMVQVTEREVPGVRRPRHTDSKRSRKSRGRK